MDFSTSCLFAVLCLTEEKLNVFLLYPVLSQGVSAGVPAVRYKVIPAIFIFFLGKKSIFPVMATPPSENKTQVGF